MAQCSLCKEPVIYARTAASEGRKSMAVTRDPRGQCWFIDGTDHKGRRARLLVVASKERPRPERGPYFRQHQFDCGPYQTKKRIERALRGDSDE